MSINISLAQTFSVDILRLIVKCMVHETRRKLDGSNYAADDLKELLLVCSTWRQVALESLWKTLQLSIDNNDSKVRLKRPSWVGDNGLPHNASKLVRELRVSVGMSGITSGAAHRLLREYMGAVTTLPLARKLVVVICECREKSKRLHDTGISNALEFAQLLKSFVLSETATELSCSTKLLQTDVVDEGALALFMQAVYQGTQRPLLVLADMGIQHSSIFDGIPSLTSLWIGCQVSVDLHSSLIHRSAATLQSLEVSLNDANLLLCNADGAHIVYPNLHHLSISHCTRADTSNDVMGRPLEFVPFPALKRLTVNHVYPFDDDVVFRGNNATLKHLKFSVSVSTVKMLNRCKVFRDSRDGVLRKVTMTECRETPDIGSVAKADIDMLLDDVLGTALSIVLSASIVHSASIASLHGRRRLENVGVLEVRTGKVSLFTVLSLLRALPRLIRISCCISGLGAELDHIPAGDLANHVVSEYGNAARGLREWTMGYSNLGDVDKTPQYVLLLALVSPIFFCQKVAKNPGSKLSEAISAAIGTKPYTKHASRLREQLLPK